MPTRRAPRVRVAPVAPATEARDRTPSAKQAPSRDLVPRVNLVATMNLIPLATKVAEDFGRDHNLKSLLKTLQPKAFSEVGTNVPNALEEWIAELEDYFALVEYNSITQGIM